MWSNIVIIMYILYTHFVYTCCYCYYYLRCLFYYLSVGTVKEWKLISCVSDVVFSVGKLMRTNNIRKRNWREENCVSVCVCVSVGYFTTKNQHTPDDMIIRKEKSLVVVVCIVTIFRHNTSEKEVSIWCNNKMYNFWFILPLGDVLLPPYNRHTHRWYSLCFWLFHVEIMRESIHLCDNVRDFHTFHRVYGHLGAKILSELFTLTITNEVASYRRE